MQEDTIYLTEEVCIQAGLDDVSENSTTKVVGEWCSLFSVSHTFLLTTLDIPSSDSSSSAFFSSPLLVSASWVRNTGTLGFDKPSILCPNVAETGVCWRRDWAQVGPDCRQPSKRVFLPKGTCECAVHSNWNVPLIKSGIGRTRVYRQVDNIW